MKKTFFARPGRGAGAGEYSWVYSGGARPTPAPVRQVRLPQKKEGFRMEDKMILPRPQQPEGKGDLDDWIFRGDSWIISDR